MKVRRWDCLHQISDRGGQEGEEQGSLFARKDGLLDSFGCN